MNKMVTYSLEIIRILKKSKEPMTPKKITEEMLKRGNIKPRGSTPQATVSARIIEEIKEKGIKSIFLKTPKGFVLNKQNLKWHQQKPK